MIDIDKIRKIIVKGLKDYLQIKLIKSNQTGDIPKYPYGSYTINAISKNNNGTWEQHSDGTFAKMISQTWSITFQSDDSIESAEIAMKARNWFELIGRTYLKDNNITVQSVGNITPRDNLITIEYEHRNGFDVVFYLMDTIEGDIVTAETGIIDSITIGDKTISKKEGE